MEDRASNKHTQSHAIRLPHACEPCDCRLRAFLTNPPPLFLSLSFSFSFSRFARMGRWVPFAIACANANVVRAHCDRMCDACVFHLCVCVCLCERVYAMSYQIFRIANERV